jgi:hypothetical protein
MKINEIRSAVLKLLNDAYEAEGVGGHVNETAIARALGGVPRSTVLATLHRMRDDEGFVQNGSTAGSVGQWWLTTYGVEAAQSPDEEPGMAAVAPILNQVNFHGGNFTNLQTGANSTQNIVTYSTILQTLVEKIEESPDVPTDVKSDLIGKVRAVLAHPLTQTILAAGAGFAAGQ